ncbi:MAG: hypothetical protein AAGC55_26900, partial [Myxococcota bacterium]
MSRLSEIASQPLTTSKGRWMLPVVVAMMASLTIGADGGVGDCTRSTSATSDGGPDQCGDQVCPNDRPVCDTSVDQCAACLPERNDCANNTNGTRCIAGDDSSMNQCGCESNSDCPSLLCGNDSNAQTCRSTSEIIYVGGNAASDTDNCGMEPNGPCASIVKGLEQANGSDEATIIYVSNGTYEETLTIMQDIRIIGESRDGVIIKPGGESP